MTNQHFATFTLDELKSVIDDRLNELIKNLPSPSPKEDELITENEARAILKVSKVTLKTWRDKNLITGYKIGTRVRYKKDELLNSLLTKKKFGRVC